jgi:serine/threonine protein kinase/pimeloyl-ACP methyl ester carboxylesterase
MWQPPAAFDDFEIVRYLGSGGMAYVFLARDTVLDRAVAIKFVSPTAADPAAHERFALEARAIARLHHPNVVGVYRFGAVAGHPYLAYEYVPGRRLDRLPRPLEWQRVLAIGVGLARGLAAAHHCGVLHRDIKPGNIMINDAGEVKLLDFGMAKLGGVPDPGLLPSPGGATAVAAPGHFTHAPTQVIRVAPELGSDTRLTNAGTVVGTPLYIAPELWSGAAASERSDLHALGVVLYELLTGELPHAHLSGEALATALATTAMPRLCERMPQVPVALTRLIDRCVELRPADRPRSASEVRDCLEALTTLYRPVFAGGDGNKEAALLAASFARVHAEDEHFAADFYRRWFIADPAVQSLFHGDLSQQQRMLTMALKLAIDNVHSPERLVPLLEDIGRRHAHYGVMSRHFGVMGRALLESLAAIDPRWDAATERSWQTAYAHIVEVLLRSMEAELVSQPQTRLAVGRERWTQSFALPRVRWVRRERGEVGYQVFGSGPIDVLVIGDWVTDLAQLWGHGAPAGFFRRLASLGRVIIFDRRGCGSSERGTAPSLDAVLGDIRDVLAAAGSDQPAVLGLGHGAAVAVAMAAMSPGRVRALALVGGGARLLPDASLLAAARVEIDERWGGAVFVEQLAPSLAGDASYRRWWAATLRGAATPSLARALLDLAAEIDITSIAATVQVPTLLVNRADDVSCPIEQARALAAAIPRAQLAELPGADHVPWAGDTERVLDLIRGFLGHLSTARVPTLMTATVLAVRLPGPARASEMEAFDVATRRELVRHSGVLMDGTVADVRVAVFDAPMHALRCACALAAAMRAHDCTVAIGVDTGELGVGVEFRGPVAERVRTLAARAKADEILVGEGARRLATGLEFHPHADEAMSAVSLLSCELPT